MTNNNYDDNGAQLSGDLIVWEGRIDSDYEIFVYDGISTTQLTDNNYHDRAPQIGGNTIAWTGRSGADDEIFVAIAIPEPSTYALATFGLFTLAFYGWRRKKAN